MKKETFIYIKTVISHIKNMLFYILIMLIGYLSSESYHYIMNIKNKEHQKIINKKQLSIALNEKEDLIIIDYFNKETLIFKDSIGRDIFNLYITLFHSKYQNN